MARSAAACVVCFANATDASGATNIFSEKGRAVGDLSSTTGRGKADLAAIQEVVSQCVREQTTMWLQYIAEAERCVFDLCQKVWAENSIPDFNNTKTLGLTKEYSRALVSIFVICVDCKGI
jgi:hypothetical protein